MTREEIASEKAKEIIHRINEDCKQNTAAYTESQIYEALIEMHEWTHEKEEKSREHLIESMNQQNRDLMSIALNKFPTKEQEI